MVYTCLLAPCSKAANWCWHTTDDVVGLKGIKLAIAFFKRFWQHRTSCFQWSQTRETIGFSVKCISHPCTAASRQLPLWVGQSRPLLRNLNLVTEINWHSTAKHMSAWLNADVCTCWKHPSSNWLETLQFPAWRKMTFTCPCHWHKTNRKAITSHLELCLSCHGPLWKAGYWLRNFQGSTHGELNWVDLRHMLNLLKPAMGKMWSNKEPPAFNGLRHVNFFFGVDCISHPCTAASRQLPLRVGQSRPLLRNLNLVTEINWHSTGKHMSAWSNADVCTCWKHPSSNWLETLQFPAWRKMTFTCPCHWHKTNRKAITSHLELCLSCHGPLWKAGYWLRNFQGSTHGELNWVDLRHMLNLLKPAMEKMWSNKEPPAFNGLRCVKPLVLVSIAFLIPALQRQDSCLCGSDKAVHFLAISIWWLRLIDIQQESTCPLDRMRMFVHTENIRLATGLKPFNFQHEGKWPSHTRAIDTKPTGRQSQVIWSLAFLVMGLSEKQVTDFGISMDLGGPALGCVHLRHDLWKENGEQIKNLLISNAQNHMFWCSSGNCPSYPCTVPSRHLPLWLVQLTSSLTCDIQQVSNPWLDRMRMFVDAEATNV